MSDDEGGGGMDMEVGDEGEYEAEEVPEEEEEVCAAITPTSLYNPRQHHSS